MFRSGLGDEGYVLNANSLNMSRLRLSSSDLPPLHPDRFVMSKGDDTGMCFAAAV